MKNTDRKRLSPYSLPGQLVLFSVSFCLAGAAHAAAPDNLFFLHHSTGNGLIEGGNMRGVISAYNAAYGTAFAFWDHGYNGDGLRDPNGNATGTSYDVPGDNTNPDGLHYLWTSTEADATACRNTILANHQVIAFKSCFPASAIPDADTLAQYKAWYLEMRSAFDQHPDRLFVVISTPPLHRLSTTAAEAANARQFANWMKSQEYLGGRANVVCFDLFNCLAGSDNMLKYEYEGSHGGTDSHPNDLANQTVGPVFADYLINAALNFNATNTPIPAGLGAATIRANGNTNEVSITHPGTVCITVEMNAGESAGVEADWWALALAHGSGEWYYLDGSMQWLMFSGNLAECRPAYQGALFDLPAATILSGFILPRGGYSFYFGVDRRDGILNAEGPIEYDSVYVVVQ